jgi:hypothetical protein
MYILQWPEVRIWIHDLTAPTDVKIDATMQSMLLNAALAVDEGEDPSQKSEQVPTSRWIREHRPNEVNIDKPIRTVHKSETEQKTREEKPQHHIDRPVSYINRYTGATSSKEENPPPTNVPDEQVFLQKVAEVLEKNKVSLNDLDMLFDQAISAFREKDYEKSRELWLQAEEQAPGHPVIKQNLKILEKYLT